jgi:hypothetical protein
VSEAASRAQALGGVPVLRVPIFGLGRIVATPRALHAILASNECLVVFVARHLLGDWGDVLPTESDRNDGAARSGGHLLSEYPLRNGQRIWIVTEADRSQTTVLLSHEY